MTTYKTPADAQVSKREFRNVGNYTIPVPTDEEAAAATAALNEVFKPRESLFPATLADVLADPNKCDTWIENNIFNDDLRARNDAEIVDAIKTVVEIRLVSDGAYYAVMFGMGSKLIADAGWEMRKAWTNPLRMDSESARDWLWLWQTREVDGVRKPYADALEGAVAEYRRPARPFSTCPVAMMELIDAMNALNFGCKCVFNPPGDWQFCDFHQDEDEESIGINDKSRYVAVAKLPIAACWKGQE